MTNGRAPRAVMLTFGAAALLGLLVFLFVRTQSVDFKAEAHALTLLREMKDLDARWDTDALRLASELGAPAAGSAPVADRAALLARILRDLEQDGVDRAIADGMSGLRTGLAEKTSAFRALVSAHRASMEALAEFTRQAEFAVIRMSTSKSRGSAPAERAAAFLSEVEHVRSGFRSAGIEDHAAVLASVAPRIASLAPAAAAADPALAGPAAQLEAAARGFVDARGTEISAWRRFSFLTLGARLELTASSVSKSIEAALDEKDRWRVYLAAYAAALLIGVGYLGARVVTTQRALRQANEELERRVAERTSELTRAMSRLKESEAQLVQTEKMSSLGQLVAGVVHEINTPLAYVKNSVASVRDRMPQLREALAQSERLLAVLQSEAPGADDLQAAFAGLSARLAELAEHQVLYDLDALTKDGLHGIEQISELVSNLRNFARLDRSKVASYNVNDSVRSTLLIARPLLRRIDIEKRLDEIPSITCSPSQVNQVLLNLITNSVQAMIRARGRIMVITRREGLDHVAIEIEDNGRGMSPEVLPRIFDPFFTTKDVGKGTGLGLSIAYKIVSQHGGRIDVRSELGKGTTFTVVLPIRPPPELETAAAEAEEAIA